MPKQIKADFFQVVSKQNLSKLKITKDLSEWDKFKLDPTYHALHCNEWENLYKQDVSLARKFVQAQTLSYIQKHPDLKATPSSLIKASHHFPDVNARLKDSKKTTVEVKAMDCLYVAEEFTKRGKRVAVLNMANQYRKGGGYEEGAGAQEEDLFRRTNLFSSLNEKHYAQKAATDYEKNGFGEFNALYSDTVTVLRQGLDKQYRFFSDKKQFTISVISSAAYNLKFSKVQEGTERYLTGTERKIIMQLETALQQGHKNLVLSAFGCGAFNNNPATIAKLYKKILNMPRYRKAFEHIVFAIVPNPGSHKDNYLPFKQVFQGKTQQLGSSWALIASMLGGAMAALLLSSLVFSSAAAFTVSLLLGSAIGFMSYYLLSKEGISNVGISSLAKDKKEILLEKSKSYLPRKNTPKLDAKTKGVESEQHYSVKRKRKV